MKRNNRERQLWIDNDEGLYMAWKSSRLNKERFIKENREEIDTVIDNILSGRRRPHYLVYG